MDIVVVLPILLLLAAVGVVIAFLGMRSNEPKVRIEERLAAFAENPMTLEEVELSLPFKDRVLTPFLLRLARNASRFSPNKNVEKTRQLLMEAGSPSKIGVSEFLGLRFVLAGILGGAFDEVDYLRTYIRYLRQKLEPDPAKPRYLLTSPGFGYRLAPD